jgi:hypothetical protein
MLDSKLQSRPSIENIFNYFAKANFHAYFLNVFVDNVALCILMRVNPPKTLQSSLENNVQKALNFTIKTILKN